MYRLAITRNGAGMRGVWGIVSCQWSVVSGQLSVVSGGDIVIIYGQHNSKILVENVSTFFVHDYTDNGIKGQCVCGVETCRPRVSTPHAI